MYKKHVSTIYILISLVFYQNSFSQEHKQIWVNFYSNGTVEYAVYIPDFSIDNAQSILDKYIKDFKTLSKVMKKLDELDITFWDTDLPNIDDIMRFLATPLKAHEAFLQVIQSDLMLNIWTKRLLLIDIFTNFKKE